MNKNTLAAITLALGMVSTASMALAQSAEGTTLAGEDNGANAKASETGKTAEQGATKSGSPSAQPGPGQSTEHSDGTMRAKKNF